MRIMQNAGFRQYSSILAAGVGASTSRGPNPSDSRCRCWNPAKLLHNILSGGRIQPTVQWDGDSNKVKLQFCDLKKDTKTAPAPPPKKDPDAMDLHNAGKGKKPVICNKCGGKRHSANQCLLKDISGYEALVEDPDTNE
ncbi:hypothetical protein RhiJN_25836 [Ceratobasidium sp. AG-Ba]|nr:hypothetical protein RhiJN_25836 [Ceratobasidium sp. AG-Ba]